MRAFFRLVWFAIGSPFALAFCVMEFFLYPLFNFLWHFTRPRNMQRLAVALGLGFVGCLMWFHTEYGYFPPLGFKQPYIWLAIGCLLTSVFSNLFDDIKPVPKPVNHFQTLAKRFDEIWPTAEMRAAKKRPDMVAQMVARTHSRTPEAVKMSAHATRPQVAKVGNLRGESCGLDAAFADLPPNVKAVLKD